MLDIRAPRKDCGESVPLRSDMVVVASQMKCVSSSHGPLVTNDSPFPDYEIGGFYRRFGFGFRK